MFCLWITTAPQGAHTKRPLPGNPGRGLFYDSIRYVGYYSTLGERILGRIQHSLRLIEIQILYRYADVLEYFVQSLAEVSESNSTVVREVLLDQYVTIETSDVYKRQHRNEGLCRRTGAD